MKRIILCADDYGQNNAISQAIITLLNKKRLSAVSCLVTAPGFSEAAKRIIPFNNQVDIGLHFNLTEGTPLTQAMRKEGFIPWWKWLYKGYFYQVDRKALTHELNAQIDRFKEAIGRLPDFIDGHQHVHQFPIIGDILIEVYCKRQLRSYIRTTYHPGVLGGFYQPAYLKRVIIQFLLAISFKMQLYRRKIHHNSSFSGIYNFLSQGHFDEQFRQFLRQIKDLGIIMCHPGWHDPSDPIGVSREKEFAYFVSDAFLKDCEAQNILLTRLSNE